MSASSVAETRPEKKQFFKCEAATFEGDFRMRLVGDGDGGPGTKIVHAWIFLPMSYTKTTVLQMWRDGQLTDEVKKLPSIDRVHVHAQEAEQLVANPALRELTLKFAQEHNALW